MRQLAAKSARRSLSVAALSGALGIPVIEGAVASRAGTVVEVSVAQLDEYRPLMHPGSLAVVDVAAGAVMVRLGESETWLMACAEGAPDRPIPAAGADSGALMLEGDEFALDSQLANHVASVVAQAPGFGVVARKPAFRDDFARPFVTDLYCGVATEWHVREIAARARNLWEFGVLPREAKRMHAAGDALRDIATALGVSRSRAKWAIELPDAHSMASFL